MNSTPPTSASASAPELRQEMRHLLVERALNVLRNPASSLRDIKLIVDLVHKAQDQELRARQVALSEGRRADKKSNTASPSPSRAASAQPAAFTASPSPAPRSTKVLPLPLRPEDATDPEPDRFLNREERRRRKFHPRAA